MAGDGEKKVRKSNDLSEAARKLGERGGKIGGPARSRSLSAEERSAIAKQGGLARAAKLKAVKSKAKKRKKKEG